jgi:hypothetical protein
MKNEPTNCPHCKSKNSVVKFSRMCRECGVALYFDGDTPNDPGQWYMFMQHGKFGPGWYQKALLVEAEFSTPNPIVRA